MSSMKIRRKLRTWSNLLKKSLMENFIFCAVEYIDFIEPIGCNEGWGKGKDAVTKHRQEKTVKQCKNKIPLLKNTGVSKEICLRAQGAVR